MEGLNGITCLTMSSKKRRVDAECRAFIKSWTAKYFFTEVGSKAVCLVCNEDVAVFKDYNLNRHFDTKHTEIQKSVGR